MVQLKEKAVNEFLRYKHIRICCRHCSQEIADFVYVKSKCKFWEINYHDINWDTNYTVQSGHIICICAEKLGNADHNDKYQLNKENIKLTY